MPTPHSINCGPTSGSARSGSSSRRAASVSTGACARWCRSRSRIARSSRVARERALHRLISSARNVHASVDVAKGRIGTDPALADAGSEAPTIAMAPARGRGRLAELAETEDIVAFADGSIVGAPARVLRTTPATVSKRTAAQPAATVARTASTVLGRSNETLSHLRLVDDSTSCRRLESSANAALSRLAFDRTAAACGAAAHRSWRSRCPACGRARAEAGRVCRRHRARRCRRRHRAELAKSPVATVHRRWPSWGKWAVVSCVAIALVVMGWRDRRPESARNPALCDHRVSCHRARRRAAEPSRPRAGAGPSIRRNDLPAPLLRTRSLVASRPANCDERR
jgi:hypothetical protein